MTDRTLIMTNGTIHVGNNVWVPVTPEQQQTIKDRWVPVEKEQQAKPPLNMSKIKEPFHPLNVNESNEEPLPLPCMVNEQPMPLPYMVSNGSCGEEPLPLPSSLVRNEEKQPAKKASCDCDEHLPLPSTYRSTK